MHKHLHLNISLMIRFTLTSLLCFMLSGASLYAKNDIKGIWRLKNTNPRSTTIDYKILRSDNSYFHFRTTNGGKSYITIREGTYRIICKGVYMERPKDSQIGVTCNYSVDKNNMKIAFPTADGPYSQDWEKIDKDDIISYRYRNNKVHGLWRLKHNYTPNFHYYKLLDKNNNFISISTTNNGISYTTIHNGTYELLIPGLFVERINGKKIATTLSYNRDKTILTATLNTRDGVQQQTWEKVEDVILTPI